LQYTPLAPFVREWRAEIVKGGSHEQIAWSKLIVGSAILSAATDLALGGTIVGNAGGDEKLRAAREAQGIQPNSVRIGDQTYAIRSLGPWSELVGMAANFADVMRVSDFEEDAEFEDVFSTAALAVGQQAVNATYMRGASDLVTLLSPDSDPYEAKKFFSNLASSVVPGAVGYVARATDPVQREAFSMTEALRRKYQDDALALKRDRWGRVMTYESGLGKLYDTFSPIYAKTVHTEPIDIELDRLETGITKPERSTSFNGVPVNLSKHPEIYSRYVEISGSRLLERLNAMVTGQSQESAIYADPSMTDGPEGTRAMMIASIVSQERAMARLQLIGEFPELQTLIDEGQKKRAKNIGLIQGGMQ
jgi:hypothetical protein